MYRNNIYTDIYGEVYDYYDGKLSDLCNNIIITESINENKLGLQKIKYELKNNSLVSAERDVQVVNSKCLEDINDISNIFALVSIIAVLWIIDFLLKIF